MIQVAIRLILSVGLLVAGVLGDGYVLEPADTRVYDAASGCVEVTTVVPTDFTRIRLDQTDYECEGNLCSNPVNHEEKAQIRISKEPLGDAVKVTAHICDAERHAWLGFNISSMLTESRVGFHTIFFSQEDTWGMIEKTFCIQVQKSSPINVAAAGAESVELSCVIKSSCEPFFTTLFSSENELCRGYDPVTCQIDKLDDDTIAYKTTLEKPAEGRYSFAYCQTGGDMVEYIVDWEA